MYLRELLEQDFLRPKAFLSPIQQHQNNEGKAKPQNSDSKQYNTLRV